MRRRLLIVAAIVMGIAAIATSSLAPNLPAPAPDRAGTATSTPGASPTAASAPAGEPAVQAMRADRTGQEARGLVGERLTLEVSAEEPISVQLGEDGPIEVADRASPARFDLYLDEPSDRAVTVLDDSRVIGRVIAAE